MAEYTFFFNPMSRAQIARWALHVAGVDYEPIFVDWANKPKALIEANPMGKLPSWPGAPAGSQRQHCR